MIDYIKINNLKIGSEIQNLLEFKGKFNLITGEVLIDEKKSAHYLNMIFILNERFAKVGGSLHKLYNGGEFNNDRFTFEKFQKVYEDLSRFISPDDFINVLEFGVNIQTQFNPIDFIKHILSHAKTQFNKVSKPGMEYSECEHSHYTIKIYNKGLQQPTGSNILRVEVRQERMQKLFPDGLKWSQLADLKTWEFLGEVLKLKFSDVIYYDPSINLNQIPEKERRIIERGNNPIYWRDIKSNHADRERKQFQGLIKKYGSKFNNLPELISEEVSELVKSYHYSEEEKGKTDLSDLAKSYHYLEPEDFTPKETSFDHLAKSYPLLSCNNSPTPILTTGQRFCKVTGIDISMQKDGSEFLCTTGLKYLFENNPSTFYKLKSERLLPEYLNASFDEQIYKIHHSIRNEYFNPKNNAIEGIKKLFAYPSLFDIRPFIRPEKMELAGMI